MEKSPVETEELILQFDLARMIFAEEEEEVSTVVSLKDITERKRAEEELKLRHRELSALSSIATTVHSSLDLKQVYELALDKVIEVTDVDVVAIYLVEEKTKEAVAQAHRGLSEDYLSRAGRIKYPKGVTWQVIESGEVFVTGNVQDETRIGPAGKDQGFNSVVSVPMRYKEEVIGVVHFWSYRKHHFDPQNIDLLSAIGHQVGTAVARAKLHEETQRTAKELEALNAITTTVHRSLELEETYRLAIDKVMEVADVDIVGIYLVDEGTNEAVLVSHKGFPEDYIRRAGRIRYPKGVTWKVIEGGEMLLTDNVQSDPRIGPAGQALGHHALLSLPMISEGKAIGVIHFISYEKRPFSPQEVNLLSSIGNEIATAIVKAKLHEQVQQSKSFLENLVESSPDAIISTDLKGNIAFFSKGAEEIFGYRAEEVLGQPVANHYVGGMAEARKIKALMAETGSLRNYETKLWAKDGRAVPISLSASFLKDDKGEVTGVLETSKDITEQKQLQEQVLRAEKLASVGRLTAGVAHEILNPLTVISGRAQLVLMSKDLDPKVWRALNIIQEQAGRIGKIAEGLLRFSRKLELVWRPVDLNELIGRSLALLEPELRLGSIKVVRDLDSHLPPVLADSDQLSQVFFNLLSNAKDAMPDGGNLAISTKSFKKRGKDWVKANFSDTGRGIPEKDLVRIFDPFFTTKDVGEGTGLGLAICYGIIQDHGGTISVDSKVGRGTTFAIELPAAEEQK